MSQDKIWTHFQNAGVSAFDQSMPRYSYLLSRLQVKARSSIEVLNIGVGNGKLEELLLKEGYKVTSLDPDESAITNLVNKGVNAFVGVAEDLPFEGNSFDAVIASEVLEHLEPEQCSKAVSEIHRVLNQNSYFFGTVPYEEVLEDNQTICPHCGELFHRWGHQQTFVKETLKDYFVDRFEVMEISRRSFVEWSIKPKRLIKSLFKWLLGRMGEQIASPHFYFELRKK